MTQPPRYVPVPPPGPAEVTQTDRSAQKASKAPQTNLEKRTRGAQTNRWGPTGTPLMLPREANYQRMWPAARRLGLQQSPKNLTRRNTQLNNILRRNMRGPN